MKTKVARVFNIDAANVDDVFEYQSSLVSDGKSLTWVWVDGKDREELDESYAVEMAKRLDIDLDTPEAWIEAVTARAFSAVYYVEEEYDSVDEALEKEKAFAEEARQFQEDDEANRNDPDLLVDNDEEEDEE